jgi:hypothetical protein
MNVPSIDSVSAVAGALRRLESQFFLKKRGHFLETIGTAVASSSLSRSTDSPEISTNAYNPKFADSGSDIFLFLLRCFKVSNDPTQIFQWAKLAMQRRQLATQILAEFSTIQEEESGLECYK